MKQNTTENFIKRAMEVHGNKYDYSKVEYINNKTKVCIVCPEHGEFWQTPVKHINRKHGCPKCRGLYKTINEWVEYAIQIHGDKYDYSKFHYLNIDTKSTIICPEHGEFQQSLYKHIHQKQGCPICANKHRNDNNKLTNEKFITKAKEIHGNKYDYSKVNYVNNCTKVCIVCPEHGEFWQTPHNHLQSKGCPICNESKLENEISNFLEINNINYEREKTFDWLKSKYKLRLDFYLPDYNIAIECQGEQHFKPINYFGGLQNFIKLSKNDKLKYDLCKHNNIKILYYTHSDKSNNLYISKVFTNHNELLNEII